MQFVKLYFKDFWYATTDMPGENLVVFYSDGDKLAHFSIPMELLDDYEINED